MFSTAFAQGVTATSTATPAPGGDLLSFGLPVVFMLAIYMLVIRPNNKRLSEQKQMVETLKEGDEVVTTAGLMGIISQIKDDCIYLKAAETVELLLQRQSVQHILPKGTVKLPVAITKKT